jgi:hypothetical protein
VLATGLGEQATGLGEQATGLGEHEKVGAKRGTFVDRDDEVRRQ